MKIDYFAIAILIIILTITVLIWNRIYNDKELLKQHKLKKNNFEKIKDICLEIFSCYSEFFIMNFSKNTKLSFEWNKNKYAIIQHNDELLKNLITKIDYDEYIIEYSYSNTYYLIEDNETKKCLIKFDIGDNTSKHIVYMGPSHTVTCAYYNDDKALYADILKYANEYYNGNISIAIKEILKDGLIR